MRLWEELYNPDFKPHGFEGFKEEFGLNSFCGKNTEGCHVRGNFKFPRTFRSKKYQFLRP